MKTKSLPDNFYEKVKPRLHRRIGRELRLARRVLDFGCGPCELVQYLADAYHQRIAGVDVSSESFPKHRRSQNGQRFRCVRQDAARLSVAEEG
ncbi:MAG TPA: class I SAM-dependent methyltransferase, partial [Firmicutes bacterium]|nr:class I SAM-dependent methyltransferase [Bacillota bacterium]